MDFAMYDPAEETRRTRQNLPHWEQDGITYFVTFCVGDSLPMAVCRMLGKQRDAWLRRNGIEPTDAAWKKKLAENQELLWRFRWEFWRKQQAQLDKGYGECLLKQREVAQVVKDSLLYFDQVRYRMGDFVIMPNHVHLLVQMLGSHGIVAQCGSWKRYTARRINQLLGRQGTVWQTESFDHAVRNVKWFNYYRRYIKENPARAGIPAGQFLWYESSGGS